MPRLPVPARLFVEVLLILVLAELAIGLALPVLGTDLGIQRHAWLTAGLLLLAGPALYWRCRATARRAPDNAEAPARDSSRAASIRWALGLTAAAQLGGLLLTAAGVMWQRQQLEEGEVARFDRGAERIEAEVRRRFAQPLQGLNATVGLHAAGMPLEPQPFRAYVESLHLADEYPGVIGFGFIERVTRAALPAWLATVNAVDGRPFTPQTDGSADDLYLVRMVEPATLNRAVLGMDMGAEATRREAAERAVDSGQPALSGRLRLRQDASGDSGQVGMVYLLPVFRRGSDPMAPKQRRQALVGLAYAPIAAAGLMHGVAEVADDVLAFELFDAEAPADAQQIFEFDPQHGLAAAGAADKAQRAESRLSTARSLVIGGRKLQLRVASSPAFDATTNRTSLVALALGGVLASFLCALAVWLLASGRVRAQGLAQRMTGDLDRLARVVRHTSNAVTLCDAQQRIHWVNEGFTRITGYTLAEARGRTPGELLGSGKADPAVLATLQAAARTGTACRVEVQNRDKRGQDYWIDTEVQPTHDAQGHLVGFMEIGTDITAQKLTRMQLEAAQRETDALLRTLHQHALVSVTDRAGTIVELNDAFCTASGYSREALLGQNHRVVNAGHHPAEFWDLLWHTISSGSPWRGEICNRRRDGSLYWVDSMIAPFLGADGQVAKYVSIRTDITQRKLDQQALQASQAFLDRVGRVAGVGGWRIDLRSREVIWSDETCRLHGLPPGYRPCQEETLDFYPPQARPLIERAVSEAVEHGLPWDLELPLQTADGRDLWVRVVGEPEFEDGIVVRLVGAFQDVSRRRELDEELRRKHELLLGVLENLPCGLSVFDDSLRLMAHNRKFRSLLDLPDSLFSSGGMPFEDILRFNAARGEYGDRDVELIVAETLERVRSPEPHRFERQRPNGMTLEVTGGPMPGGGLITTYTDVDERKRAEALLKEALQKAEQASVAKSQFLANMSHEIRTPMNAILGMLKLLQNTALTPRQADYAGKTEGAAHSLLGLLNDILDFSKVEAGKMTLDPRPFRIDRLLRDLSVILSACVGAKQIEMLYDIDAAVPPCLLGDDMRLQQVLINLCGNAIKFTSSGQVVFRLRVLEIDGVDVVLDMAVSDTGIGIAPENQARIFSGFSQAEASTTRRFGGTGLGLAISQRLVAMMGGELQLTSVLGEGSTFHFRLRLPMADETAAPTALTAPGASATPAPAPLHALIVDDNDSAREVLGRMVDSLGWTADLAASGADAVAMVEARSLAGKAYQVIFVDWQMPGLDGWATSQRIRQLAGVASAALVVMVTAHGREMLARRPAEEQALLDGFLVKPVTASMLRDAVREARTPALQAPVDGVVSQRRLAGLRLLVVEDNANNRQVAQELLVDEGAEVTLADDGQQGVAAVAAARLPFDAVLMDLQMPVMDGYEATAQIRRVLGLTALPIIAMTANAMASDREACLAAGMDDHVGKPFDLGHLVGVLRRHCRRSGTAAGGQRDAVDSLEVSAPRALAVAAAGGIDLPAALGRLGGKLPAYQRLLRNFQRDLAALPAQFDALCAAGDAAALGEAGRLMHTFKGLAGTLGMAVLAQATADAERGLRDEPGNVALCSAALRTAASSTQQDIDALLPALQADIDTSATPARPDTAETEPDFARMLHTLCALLQDADMRAIDIFEQLQQGHAAALGEALAPIETAIAALDFEQALALCNGIGRGAAR